MAPTEPTPDAKISVAELLDAIRGWRARYQFSRSAYASGIRQGLALVEQEIKRVLATPPGEKNERRGV